MFLSFDKILKYMEMSGSIRPSLRSLKNPKKSSTTTTRAAEHKLEGSNNVTLATGFQKQTALPQPQDTLSRRNLSLLQRKSLDSTEYEDPKDDLVSFEHTGGRWGQHADYEYEAARQTTDAPGVGEAGNIEMKVDVTDYTDEYIKNLSPQDANIRAWEGLTHEAKLSAIEVSKKLKDKGKTIIHSGYRSESQSKEDMQRVGSLNIYKKEWRDALTTKELSSRKGSDLRKIAVQKMWDAGFRSQHGNRSGVGNAFDISYPGMATKWTPKAAHAIKHKIGTPKIKITPEGSPLHIHIQLKKK